MGLSPESRARFNLERASVLVLDESPMGMSILVQILTGFGVKTLHRCEKVEEAKDVISKVEIDLIVCDALGAGGEGYDFVSWLRSSTRFGCSTSTASSRYSAPDSETMTPSGPIR